MGSIAALLTGIAALVTAVGGIVFGVSKANEGSTERTASYEVLSSRVDELIQQARADHDHIIGLQDALAAVATRAAASPTTAVAGVPAPPAQAEVSHIAATLNAQAKNRVPFNVTAVPRTLPDAVRVYQKR